MGVGVGVSGSRGGAVGRGVGESVGRGVGEGVRRGVAVSTGVAVEVGVGEGTVVAVEVEVAVGVDQDRASTCLIRRGVTLAAAASSPVTNQRAKPDPNKREKIKAQRPAIKTPAIKIRGSLDSFRLKTIHSIRLPADYTTAQPVQPIAATPTFGYEQTVQVSETAAGF